MDKNKYLYLPGVVNEPMKWFDLLKEMPDTDQKIVHVYGKDHKEPRLNGFYSKSGDGFKYSGLDSKSKGWNTVLDSLSNHATEILTKVKGERYEFNTALVNLYRDGNDRVGAHKDRDSTHGVIASYSFGAERDFVVRDNNKKMVETVKLESGSLFVMLPGFQSEYYHELPVRKKIVEPRINVTLRYH